MPPRWNTWSTLQLVKLEYERTPKERPVRLAAPSAREGDPVRIGMSRVEIEGRIADVRTAVLQVKVKAAPLRARRLKRARTA